MYVYMYAYIIYMYIIYIYIYIYIYVLLYRVNPTWRVMRHTRVVLLSLFGTSLIFWISLC